MAETRWTTPSWPPRLAAGTVDVWRAGLVGVEESVRVSLSDEERARAARFVRAEDGRRWAASRGILRALLAAYADGDARALRFVAGPHGKPRLARGADAVRFNMSHSGDLALYAFALDREVGVDVELPRRAVDHVAIARRVLGAAEAERLAALGPQARERAFLRAWVRYEAVSKCRGTGIGGAATPASGPDPWVCELDVGAPAAAALAVAGGPCAVRRRGWPAAGG